MDLPHGMDRISIQYGTFGLNSLPRLGTSAADPLVMVLISRVTGDELAPYLGESQGRGWGIRRHRLERSHSCCRELFSNRQQLLCLG